MKNFSVGLLVTILAGFIAPVFATSGAKGTFLDEVRPYIGADLQYRYMKGQRETNGTNIFEHILSPHTIGPDLYIGARIHPNIGIEFGFAPSFGAPQDYTGNSTDRFNHQDIENDDFDSKMRLQNWHIDLNGYLPLGTLGEECEVDFIVTAGISFLKPKITLYAEETELAIKTRYHPIPRVGVGIQSMLTKNIGIRTLVRFEKTSRLKINVSDGQNVTQYKPFQNGYTANLGAFLQF